MNPALLCALLGVAVVGTLAQSYESSSENFFSSSSSFSEDESYRFETCGPLVTTAGCGCSSENNTSPTAYQESENGIGCDGSGSSSGFSSGSSGWSSGSSDYSVECSSGSSSESSGSGEEVYGTGYWSEGDLCFLLQELLQYKVNISAQFGAEYSEIFAEWINETQITIVEDSSLTYYQVLVEIWYSLKVLFQQYPEIESCVKYAQIKGWGYCFELEGLAKDIQSNSSCTQQSYQDVCQLDSNGNCTLFESMDSWCDGDSQKQAAVNELISQLTIIFQSSYSFDYQMVLCYEQFQSFFANNSDWEASFFQQKCGGFGTLESFYDLTYTFWSIENYSLIVGGTVSADLTVNQCPMLQALVQVYENTSYSISFRSDLKQLVNKTAEYYSTETDATLRVQYFEEELYQFYILEDWTVEECYSVQIEGYGSLWDLIYAYTFQQNCGCASDLPYTPTTTAAPTTTPTTTTPTTTVPTTTTPTQGNCGNVEQRNVFSNGYTDLLYSIQLAQNSSWTSTQIGEFKGYYNRISTICQSSSYSATQMLNYTQTVINGFNVDSTVKTKLMAVVIINRSTNQSWGTVSQFCGCNPSSSSTSG